MKKNIDYFAPDEWGPFPFEDGKTILEIRYDPVFKAVFTGETEMSRGALSDLVSSLIGKNITVENIINNEPPVDYLGQRNLRFDLACKTTDGEPVNVEMSFNPKVHEPVRLEYHEARLFVTQDIHGRNYSDLKDTYQIAILARKKFFADEHFEHTFIYYDPKKHISLGGKTRIITIELEKTAPVAEKPVEEMTNAEKWAVFFQYLTDEGKRDKIKEITKHEGGIAMALHTMTNISQSEIEAIRLNISLAENRIANSRE